MQGVQKNLCTPKNGEILIAATQDFLTAAYLLTSKDRFFDRSQFALLCSYMGDALEHIDLPTPTIVRPLELWTVRAVCPQTLACFERAVLRGQLVTHAAVATGQAVVQRAGAAQRAVRRVCQRGAGGEGVHEEGAPDVPQ
jgi:DNA-directed RNA polymerase beta' subunit